MHIYKLVQGAIYISFFQASLSLNTLHKKPRSNIVNFPFIFGKQEKGPDGVYICQNLGIYTGQSPAELRTVKMNLFTITGRTNKLQLTDLLLLGELLS